MKQQRCPSSHPRLEAFVPSPLSWRSYRGAFSNFLLFGLAVLSGEWLAHQLQYAIEYGARFDAVMAASPHRLYMGPLGVLLALVSVLLLLLTALVLGRIAAERRHLIRRLSPRLARRVPSLSFSIPQERIGRTACVLTACQLAIYLVQENLETVSASGVWPGLGVILSPHHLTAIPLHLLVATCCAFLLWTLTVWVGRSQKVIAAARTLSRLLAGSAAAAVHPLPRSCSIPTLFPVTGAAGPRSPPCPA